MTMIMGSELISNKARKTRTCKLSSKLAILCKMCTEESALGDMFVVVVFCGSFCFLAAMIHLSKKNINVRPKNKRRFSKLRTFL